VLEESALGFVTQTILKCLKDYIHSEKWITKNHDSFIEIASYKADDSNYSRK